MGLFDKLKNIFIEELVDEDETVISSKNDEIEVKKEIVKEDNIIAEDKAKLVEKDLEKDLEISDRSLIDTNKNFKFPIIFEEDDFKEEKKKNRSINVLERENTKYETEIKKDVRPQKKVFKPSPVISPVYGVLDKNYSKEDISTKDGLLNDSDEKIDIDYVIKKAYGSEIDKIPSRESIHRDDEVEINGTIDLFNETEGEKIPEVLDETVENNTDELDDKIKIIDDMLKETDDDDFYSLVDSMYKDDELEGEEE